MFSKTICDLECFHKLEDNHNMINSINLIAETLNKTIWGDYSPKIVQNFTDHGINHSLSIIKILNKIIKNSKLYKNIRVEELYILVISALLHDIGLRCDLRKQKNVYHNLSKKHFCELSIINLDLNSNEYSMEEQKRIRKYHNYICESWIYEAKRNKYNVLHNIIDTIPDCYLNDIQKVCLYHCQLKLENLPCSKNENINLANLILLFRLADELDIGKHRISIEVREAYTIPHFNAMHWYLNEITEVHISNINNIKIEISLNSQDYEKHKNIMLHIIDNFNKKNSFILESLRNNDIIISFSSLGSKVVKNDFINNLEKEIIDEIYMDVYKKPYVNTDYENKLDKRKKRIINTYISYESDIKKSNINSISKNLNSLSKNIVNADNLLNHSVEDRKQVFNSTKYDKFIVILSNQYLKGITFNNEFNMILRSGKKCIIITYDRNFEKESAIKNIVEKNDNIVLVYEKESNIKNVRLLHTNELYTKIIYELENSYLLTDEYKSIQEQIYKNLFLTTKAESIKLNAKTFVKTKAFKKIYNEFSYIVIGRKGTGKSTLVETISEIDEDRYMGVLDINVNEIDLAKVYNLHNENIRKDIDEIIGIDFYLEMVWHTFIIVYSVYIICKHKKFTNGHRKIVKEVYHNIEKIYPLIHAIEENTATDIFYTFAKNKVISYINKCISDTFESDVSYNTKYDNKWSEFEIYIKSKCTAKYILEYIFTAELLIQFKKIISLTNKKILITMDKFDTNFDKISREINDRIKINDYENKWIYTFLEKVYTMKYINDYDPLYNKIDFVICIPKDRYLEFKKDNRDAYKYMPQVTDLSWSGIELAIMLRKRLENMYTDLNSKKTETNRASQEEILINYFNKKFYILPNLFIKTTNKNEAIPLFQYILRLSFWRPRDILTYFGKILSFVNIYKDNNNTHEVNEVVLKKVIEKGSMEIIKNEFFNEYQSVIKNIYDIVDCFKLRNQLLSWDELYEILTIDIILNSKVYKDIKYKIDILYEIGFLGIYANEEYMKRYNILHKNAFIFNEKYNVLKGIDSDLFRKCKFIIHPIFEEYLNLNLNSESILCCYNWNYLHENDIIEAI